MAINNKTWGAISILTVVLIASFAISYKLSLLNIAVSPNAPDSKPLACNEQCPNSNGDLASCTPPEADGSTNISQCAWAGRIEACGGQQWCCPGTGGVWSTNMAPCCVDSTWTPAANTVCTGTNVTQTSNCGNTKVVAGTKITGCTVACTDTAWTPAVNTKCLNVNFTQTSNCDATRSAVGTKTDGTCTACVDTTWTPDPALTCTGTDVTQTSNCGNTRVKPGTKTDTTWTPAVNTVCVGSKLTQTGDCGATKQVDGTKYCCVDTSWSPSTSNTCTENTLVQTSNCGNDREVDGTKTCLPDISISTRVYSDDSRNKPGTYFADKAISKVSRDQFMVYSMDIKNNGAGSAKNFVITDTLVGQNQDLISFTDSEDRCKYDYPSKKLTCEIEKLVSKGVEGLKFRVKVAQTAMNGKIIKNTAKVTYGNKTKQASVDVLISSIVTCNEYCNNDSECVAGLACDVFSNKCRKPTCSQSTTCSCITPTATATIKPTATLTLSPTSIDTDSAVDFPDSSMNTPTAKVVKNIITPTEIAELPNTGIFDISQTSIFGGGILLAIIGLFLAL